MSATLAVDTKAPVLARPTLGLRSSLSDLLMAPTYPAPTPLADPGTLLATTHQVGGGLCVRLRLTRPSDSERVHSFLEDLSPETRQRRFMAAMPVTSPRMVRHFTFFDPRQRLVVAATAPVDGSELIVGLADVALTHTGLAELGVVVDDDVQGRGVGKLLTEAVASLAIQQGATHVKAELLEDNHAMRRLMDRLGRTVRTVEDGNSVIYARLWARGRRAA
jgi:RimJ/RimL family protein N-acetyltransferase